MNIKINDSPTLTENSFLHETTFNSDIGIEIRKEIEKKYKNSRVNQTYIFTRKENTGNQTSRRKISFDKPKTGNTLLDKSLPYINTYRIYQREIISLIKLYFSNQKKPFSSKPREKMQKSQ